MTPPSAKPSKGSADPTHNQFRSRRFKLFADIVNNDIKKDIVDVLDIGGVEGYWSDKLHMLQKPIRVTVVNVSDPQGGASDMIYVKGDARALTMFSDQQFDIVHSNSVIEHVGRWSDMQAMAREVARLAPAYFVQTPNFWFPMEPHARTLFLHWLPEPLRFRVVMARKCGFWTKAPTVDEAMHTIQSSELIDMRMMKALFPDGEMHRESFYGFTKSLMAIRRPRS